MRDETTDEKRKDKRHATLTCSDASYLINVSDST